jgi:hypothetical protein
MENGEVQQRIRNDLPAMTDHLSVTCTIIITPAEQLANYKFYVMMMEYNAILQKRGMTRDLSSIDVRHSAVKGIMSLIVKKRFHFKHDQPA